MGDIPGGLSKEVDTFASDPRIYLDRESNTYRIEDTNGREWEFTERLKQWSLIPSPEELATWENQYKVEGVSDETTAKDSDRKRKAGEEARAAKRQKADEDRRDNLPKAIYITGLPLDTDEVEVCTVFAKYGLIDEDWKTDKPRVKLYYDEDGDFKGEALIIYFKPESVTYAIKMLDGTDLRRGKFVKGPLRVAPAERSDDHAEKSTATKAKRQPLTEKNRQKIQAKKEQMAKRLDWESDDESDGEDPKHPWERMIVITGMFTPEAFATDPAFYAELRQDIRDAAGEHGKITNLVIYDEEADGIATVRFETTEAADSAVKALDGRAYDGHKIKARISDGHEQFKKSKKDNAKDK